MTSPRRSRCSASDCIRTRTSCSRRVTTRRCGGSPATATRRATASTAPSSSPTRRSLDGELEAEQFSRMRTHIGSAEIVVINKLDLLTSAAAAERVGHGDHAAPHRARDPDVARPRAAAAAARRGSRRSGDRGSRRTGDVEDVVPAGAAPRVRRRAQHGSELEPSYRMWTLSTTEPMTGHDFRYWAAHLPSTIVRARGIRAAQRRSSLPVSLRSRRLALTRCGARSRGDRRHAGDTTGARRRVIGRAQRFARIAPTIGVMRGQRARVPRANARARRGHRAHAADGALDDGTMASIAR